MLCIREVKKENEPVLFSCLQKYLYEMSQYYGGEMNAEGNFDYPYLPFYFEEASRTALFFCEDDRVIGFCLINRHSWTNEPIDNSIAEFTIFPAYRHNGNGTKAVELLMKHRPGSWQLKYSTKNGPGRKFWKKIKEKYGGTECPLQGDEIALTIRPGTAGENG